MTLRITRTARTISARADELRRIATLSKLAAQFGETLDIRKEAAMPTTQDVMADYNTGGVRAAIACSSASIHAAKTSANTIMFYARGIHLSGADALDVRRLAEDLEQAARTLREAAGLAYKAPVLMAAE